MQKPLLFCLILSLGTPPPSAQSANKKSKHDDITIVSFSRHTFRGTSSKIGPLSIDLPAFGIDIALPNLSYAKNASPRGLEIARDFGSKGLQKAAAMAVKALGESKQFDGRWDEIRADLASERTFWTALKLRDGFKKYFPARNRELIVSGCKTELGDGVDIISTDSPIANCIPPEILRPLLAASPDLQKWKTQAQSLMDIVGTSISKKPPKASLPAAIYDEKGELPTQYRKVMALASNIEMIAVMGSPLKQLFRDSPKAPLLKNGRATLRAALNTLGLRSFAEEPTPMPQVHSIHLINYLSSQPKGSHKVVMTHHSSISQLLRALSLISSEGDLDQTAIYPIESIVFAFSDTSVSVVRMRIQTTRTDGFIAGPFQSKVLWKGTRAQWDEKVKAVNDMAKAWDLGTKGNECIKAVQVCKAEPFETLY